jgi:hypothetical protein
MLDEAWTFADLSGVGLYDEFVIYGGPLRVGFEAFTTDALLIFDSAGEALNASSDCLFFDGWMLSAGDAPETLPGGLLYFVNTQTLAVSTATLPATTVVGDGETLYVATPTRLARLAGPIEATAEPAMTTGALDLSSGATVNVPTVKLRLHAAGELVLTAVTDCDGTPLPLGYRVPEYPGTVAQERTVQLGRGPNGTRWQFTLAGGAVWSCTALTLMLDHRRLRR